MSRKPYNYDVGDIIDDMEIIQQTLKPSGEAYLKAYRVRCTECSNIKIMFESKINNFIGTSHRACGFGTKTTDRRFYNIWAKSKSRIHDVNNCRYEDYGGRGLKHDYDFFIDFRNEYYSSYLAHYRKHGELDTTIDRIENDIGYVSGNIKWSTRIEQANNKRTTVYFRWKSPDGRVGAENNQLRFAEKHGLTPQAVSAYLRDELYTCKGWRLDCISKEGYDYYHAICNKLSEYSEEKISEIASKTNTNCYSDIKEIISTIPQRRTAIFRRRLPLA